MQLTIEIDDEFLKRLLLSADCGIWARDLNFNDEGILEVDEIVEDDTDKYVAVLHRVTNEQLQAAILKLRDWSPYWFARLVDFESHHSDLGNILLQFACFGEIKYSG